MAIDRVILNEFIKATKDDKKIETGELYGVIVSDGNSKYVKIDGSNITTPVETTTDIKEGERVLVKVKNHSAIVTGNLSDPSAGNSRVEDAEGKIGDFEYIFAGNITADNIQAGAITADKILAGSITTDKLYSESVTAGKIAADSIQAGHIDAGAIQAEHIDANVINAGHISSGAIDVGSTIIRDGAIITKHIGANTIIADHIQTGALTSDKMVIADGFIKDAMIDTLKADKIAAGKIDTNQVSIGNDKIVIADSTQQFKDSNGNVRIQMGEDTNGDFNFIVRAEDGQTTLIDGTGVKENAIADGLIKENMIGEGEIGGTKIDWDSFTSEFNADTNTNTLKGSKIYLDTEEQTLEVAFSKMSNGLGSSANSLKIYYATSNSPTVPPTTGWVENSPQWQEGLYIWMKTETIKNDESSVFSNPVCIQGAKGEDGLIGSDGVGVKSISPQYALSSSKTEAPTTGWSDTPPKITDGNYLWTRNKIILTNNQTTYSSAIFDTNLDVMHTELKTVNGEITTLISNTTIAEDGNTISLKDSYSAFKQDVNNFKISVADTYTTKTEFEDVEKELSESIGLNKWKRYKYNKGLASHTSFPTFNDLENLSPVYSDEYVDDRNLISGITGEYFIVRAYTNVYVSVDKVVTLTPNSSVDDTFTCYLNGIKVSQVANLEVTTLNLKNGWNTLEILFYEHNGNDVLTFTTKISDHVDKMAYAISDAGSNGMLESTKSNIAQLKVETTGITSRVESVETTTTKLNNQVGQDRLNIRCNDLGVKINYSEFNAHNNGELYLHGFNDNGVPTDTNGKIYWNGNTYPINKTMVNANSTYGNKDLYLCSNTTANGGVFIAYFDDSVVTDPVWKYKWISVNNTSGIIDLSTSPAFCIGQLKMKDAENFEYAYLYSSPVKLENAIGVAKVETRLKSAEQKITDDAIVSTVTKSNSWTNQTSAVAAAQSIANTAKTTADSAKSDAGTANSKLGEMANDNKLTATEKQQSKKEWDIIAGEKSKIEAEAVKFGVNKDTYVSRYNTLQTYLSPLFSNLTTTSDITGSTFRNKFKDYYNARQDVLNGISTKAKSLADNAQTKANSAHTLASSVDQKANNLTVSFKESGGYNLLRNGMPKNNKTYWSTREYQLAGSNLTRSVTYRNDSWTGNEPAINVQIANMTSGEYGFSQTITTVVGKKYVFSCYLAGHRSNKMIVIRGNTASNSGWLVNRDYGEIHGGLNLSDWVKVEIPFVAERTDTTIEININNTIGSEGYIWAKQLMVCEGTMFKPFSPNPNEVYDGITMIDKDGITVTSSNVKSKTSMSSSGFKITKTDNNEDVFKVNADGTLYMKGQMTITGGSVPSANLTGTIDNGRLNSTITNGATAGTSAKNTLNSKAGGWDSTKSTVDTNKNNWSNTYNRVNEWAYGAVTGSTTIDGGFIQTDTITAKHIAIGDLNNYCQLQKGKNLVSNFGTAQWSEGTNNHCYWQTSHAYFPMTINETPNPFKAGDQIQIKFDAYTPTSRTVKVGVWFYSDAAAGNNIGATSGSVSCTNTWGTKTVNLTLSKGNTFVQSAKSIAILIQNGSSGERIEVRNITVRRLVAGDLIVDGSVTATKMNITNAATVGSGGNYVKIESQVFKSYCNNKEAIIMGGYQENGTYVPHILQSNEGFGSNANIFASKAYTGSHHLAYKNDNGQWSNIAFYQNGDIHLSPIGKIFANKEIDIKANISVRNGNRVGVYNSSGNLVGKFDYNGIFSNALNAISGSLINVGHTLRNTNSGVNTLGTKDGRWNKLFAVTAPDISSDIRFKENVRYLEVNSNIKTLSLDDNITQNDMYEFVKRDLDVAEYKYINDEYNTYGFIAQDVVDTKVGSTFIHYDEEGYLSYDSGAYVNILASALKEEIKLRESLEERLEKIEQLLLNKL